MSDASLSARRSRVLVISNIPWDFVWQRHQTLASLFAEEHEVVFCELPGIRRVTWRDFGRVAARLWALGKRRPASLRPPPHLRLLRPFVLPATNAWFCAFNGWQMRRMVSREPAWREGVALILDYSASRTALQLMARVPHRRLVYDCTDDWLAVAGIPSFLAGDETTLLRRADLTLVPSRVLETRKSVDAQRCVRLPHGALVERFLVEPKAPAADGRLTLLYYGHLHRQHLDFALLEGIARARPDWTILLVGPVKTPHEFPENVRLEGQQAHEQLSKFVQEADVLLLPYVLNRYTEAVMPAKTYECLATGRPVVATGLPELRAELADQLVFASGLDGWLQAIAQAVAEDSPAKRSARMARARANSWQARFAQLQELLAALPDR